MFNTYSNEDYDRRNEEVDPVASSAEYELEKRVEKLELFPVELEKGGKERLNEESVLSVPHYTRETESPTHGLSSGCRLLLNMSLLSALYSRSLASSQFFPK